jgi:hypothetical protein
VWLLTRIETSSPTLLKLCSTPGVGALAMLILCLGPPTLVALVLTSLDLVAGYHHFVGPSYGPTPLYAATVGFLAVPWNLWLERHDVRVSLMLVRGWAFGLLCASIAAVAWWFGLE